MFLEPSYKDVRKGWIEVICGSMFSGKTEELIRRLNRAKIANKKVMIFKPETDTRYNKDEVVSHDKNSIPSIPIKNSRQLLDLVKDVDVIGIDEGQFFDDELPEICRILAKKGSRIIVAGLDMDFEGKPFYPMPVLMAIADYVTKVHAICMQCGDIAMYSFRLNQEKSKVLVGEKEYYEARCRTCFYLDSSN